MRPHPETLREYRRRRAYCAALEAVEPIETVFDRIVNWLAEHPRLTAVMVCAFALSPLLLEAPR
ncbi:hypothetical protein EN875_032300 [Mesorhizobium sp. M2D.F.Ca.ET.232.01.1.1]|uniref:hypothetical protein n=1 Tax=Mesorhizobium sp. M2D.F.Ca.ET.232.01.1.1 TaxID=2496670 RepID=UPI000FCA55D7|nr:hypothetical protein [Mesorhizobium sp. M2D.F.Ca.ET.232.01.1.1]TGP28240.1 hypothetical protein EN875_032300 [Mesorhizobium sp. M2D.F.Ca.ET.232.01.1.1]